MKLHVRNINLAGAPLLPYPPAGGDLGPWYVTGPGKMFMLANPDPHTFVEFYKADVKIGQIDKYTVGDMSGSYQRFFVELDFDYARIATGAPAGATVLIATADSWLHATSGDYADPLYFSGDDDTADNVAPSAALEDARVIAVLQAIDEVSGNKFRVLGLEDTPGNHAIKTTGLLGTVARVQGFDVDAGIWQNIGIQAPMSDNQNTGLERLLTDSSLRVMSSGLLNILRKANVFATGYFNAAGNNVIYTPAAGLKYRLLGYTLELSANASMAAAGENNIGFFDNGNPIGVSHSIWLPAAAGANPGAILVNPLDMGAGYVAAAAETPLQLNIPTALATGHVRVNVALSVSAAG